MRRTSGQADRSLNRVVSRWCWARLPCQRYPSISTTSPLARKRKSGYATLPVGATSRTCASGYSPASFIRSLATVSAGEPATTHVMPAHRRARCVPRSSARSFKAPTTPPLCPMPLTVPGASR